jgi:G:T-mismatch repair DNA endonuclease (very short patch repair protein)
MADKSGRSIMLSAAHSDAIKTHLTVGTLLCKMGHAVHLRPMVRGRVQKHSVHTPGEPSTMLRIWRCVLFIGSLFERDLDGICPL